MELFSNYFSNADESWRTFANPSERKPFDCRGELNFYGLT
jgi:hypothetical protein